MSRFCSAQANTSFNNKFPKPLHSGKKEKNTCIQKGYKVLYMD